MMKYYSSQRGIAQILQVSSGTVNRDLSYLRQQAKHNIKRYIDERLPEVYENYVELDRFDHLASYAIPLS